VTTAAIRPRSGRDITRATAVMSVGTALSRLTGLLRVLALIYAVHTATLADSYNLANTMPNIVVDLMLGGIVAATFVPVFVQYLTERSDDEAWEAISAVVSVTVVAIGIASVAFLAAAPLIIHGMTLLDHSRAVGAERNLATELLVLSVPQLTCYGLMTVATALLNARRSFAAPMFAPIANNLVLIGVLVLFGTIVRDRTPSAVEHHQGLVLLLGLGTTVGVAVQAAVMVPSLRRVGLRLRWAPRLRHQAVRTIVRLSGWTMGLVVANQLALLVVLALLARTAGDVSAYTYAYTFFQLPYGVVAMSIMSATAPELAEHWTVRDLDAFRRRFGSALRRMLAIIVPAAALLVVLGRPLLDLVGAVMAHPTSTAATGLALSMLALGLPGFCVFIYGVRALQAIQDLRSAFWLYALENGVNIVLAVVLAGPAHLGLRGVTLSISIAYTVAAVAALVRLRNRVEAVSAEPLGRPLGRIAVSTAALVVGAALTVNLSASTSAAGLLVRVTLGLAGAAAGYVGAAGILGVVAHRRRPRRTPAHLRRGRLHR
jgi:putative peptidoglycan lipid II flippase